MRLVNVSRNLSNEVEKIPTKKAAAFTYNPLSYARIPHELYLSRYGTGKKEVLLLGMNPGPFGMAQTGVPFGDVAMVRDFLGISGKVSKPQKEHPRRPISGFECSRSEVSGTRLWSWARDHFDSPDAFFRRFFVANYCPLVFMEESGKNLTPDKIPKDVRALVEIACDRALRDIVAELQPKWVLGVGAFADKQARRALASTDIRIGSILHPSPASPLANRGWAEQVQMQLRELGIEIPARAKPRKLAV
jgi:single-strand selective monofunctional uracil DNA glycosylase